jgi:DNA modification methylase/ParB-like chromosome segregation protein Spo0J
MKPKQRFKRILLSEIHVDERFRQDLGDIEKLAENLAKRGTFHPLVITPDYRLLAGGRRFAAARFLKWEEIDCHIIDEVDDITAREIELEENTQRKDLSWQEDNKLTAAIHELYTQKYGPSKEGAAAHGLAPEEKGWSLKDTAQMRGYADSGTKDVRRAITLTTLLKVMPSLENEKSLDNALRKARRLEEDIVRELYLRRRNAEAIKLGDSVVCGDATSLILKLDTASVDCIITDPPYGDGNIDAGSTHRTEKEFDDSPESALALLRSIGPELRRVLRPNGHLYAFFSPRLYRQSIDIWKSSGFEVRDVICIWHKLGGDTGTVNWDKDYAPTWEPFLFAHNGERRLAHKRENVFDYKPDSGEGRYHPNQKPVALIQELIAQSTDPGDLVFDPFGGSGSVAVAATQTHRRFLTFELNERFVSVIKQRVIEAAEKEPIDESIMAAEMSMQDREESDGDCVQGVQPTGDD